MSHHDLSEIDLREGDLRIRLRRGAADLPVVQTVIPAATATPVAQQAVQQPPKSEQTAAAPTGKHLSTIKSPTPGTFYSAPTPDAQPFVQVGARVTPSTVVCVIEAMKIFNEITADCEASSPDLRRASRPWNNQVLFRSTQRRGSSTASGCSRHRIGFVPDGW